MPNPSILSQRLLSARKAIRPRVLQKDVAKKLKLSPSAVNLWEKGKTAPSVEQLIELARWYKVSIDWLAGAESDPRKGPAAALGISAVPIIDGDDVARWRLSAAVGLLQAAQDYPDGTAAAIRITSDALKSVCPQDSFVIVSKGHQVRHNDAVVAVVTKTGAPVLRRFVTEAGQELLIADDSRYPTLAAGVDAKIVGRVTEVSTTKLYF